MVGKSTFPVSKKDMLYYQSDFLLFQSRGRRRRSSIIAPAGSVDSREDAVKMSLVAALGPSFSLEDALSLELHK